MANYITDFHGCEEALKKGDVEGVLYLSKQSKRAMILKKMAEVKELKIKNISIDEMDKMSSVDHRGFLLQIKNKSTTHKKEQVSFETFIETFDKDNGLVVILDSITDPHNYGAILRSCDQFGVDLVIIPSRRSASETPVVSRVSAGAVNYVNVAVVTNLNRAIKQVKKAGFWVYGADMGGKSAPDIDFKGRVALIMGSEGTGMHQKVKESCDGIVSIPTKGNVDSLNVSVATGILLYEISRQQN
ncbi:MAG: 23S rRNA (guanosine(2251)-2'-O)-methyltransferase RlmB [Spirochaetaceae bacterium 4572_7]|nr:MAG: 23S rRNA (guanosine(2251)-2'-O)-methyltransferase RlmB [Spirochaetaceae bacterium 4572_7]